LSESRDDDVTRLESRVAQLEAECHGHVVKMAAVADERHSLTNQLRELSRRQRQVSFDWLSVSREQLWPGTHYLRTFSMPQVILDVAGVLEPRQVVHTHCLFPDRCKLVRAKGGDALQLGRQLRA